MHEIAAETYVRLTTFTRDGVPKPTPVWITDLGDDRVGFTTGSTTWKVKRIRATPTVELQPSDARGKARAGSDAMTGTAVVVEGAEFERVRDAVKAKYGWQWTVIAALNRIRGLVGRGQGVSDRGVVITLDTGD